MSGKWMIYGAYGYTGELVAELAKKRGHEPILAGRRADKLAPIAERLGFPTRVFDLDNGPALRDALKDVDAVLHAAGPFSATSRPMVDACLASGAHYLDITGEIGVFEAIHRRDAEAKKAGVSLIPGVGFDVVPTDGLAAMLAAGMEDATHLELAFVGLGSTSVGTTKTMVEGMPKGGAARIDGRIKRVPVAWKLRQVPFHDKSRQVVSLPWGDVSTAFYSTGIGNIITYFSLPKKMIKATKLLSKAGPLLALSPVQKALKRLVELTVKNPTAEHRAEGKSEVWGEVRNAAGQRLSGTLSAPDGYQLTADAALRAMVHVLEGVAPGALTPSMAFGREFVKELDGVTVHAFEASS